MTSIRFSGIHVFQGQAAQETNQRFQAAKSQRGFQIAQALDELKRFLKEQTRDEFNGMVFQPLSDGNTILITNADQDQFSQSSLSKRLANDESLSLPDFQNWIDERKQAGSTVNYISTLA